MTSDKDMQNAPKSTLQTMEVHEDWKRHFRTAENDRFFGMAFDYIAEQFGPPGDDIVLDAGCGSGTKSLQLARRGYRVRGIDFCTAILDEARAAAAKSGFADRLEFSQGDLTSLDIPAGSVQHIVCWGVLMHVPDLDQAISELARILAPGGKLVISEGNFRSLQAVTLRCLKRMLGRERAAVRRTSAGIEFWEPTEAGLLLTRQADIPWLTAAFQRRGLELTRRRAGQFTEIYTLLPWKPLRAVVHAVNHVWFRRFGWGRPAFGNILVFLKH